MSLRIFVQMVHKKLHLEDIDGVALLWISEHVVPWTLKNDHAFFWFWENVIVNGNDFIQLIVKVNNSEWNKEVTPKKTTSKSPQVRRSSRLGCDKNQSAGGCSARKLFGHGSSQPTQTSVVGDNVREGSSNTPVVDDDYFDEEHWYDELVIQVENKEVDECHPVEDHEAVVAYNTDEDNEDTSNAEN
ncbi:hypothetical protein C5167_007512 [Papaver somniferum]|nr:hypothetical protein C5167_007512 [Papaver somniferum]